MTLMTPLIMIAHVRAEAEVVGHEAGESEPLQLRKSSLARPPDLALHCPPDLAGEERQCTIIREMKCVCGGMGGEVEF